VGRQAELAVLARFLEGVTDGPRALLIDGEAGIGKTTLWREAVRIGRTKGRVLVARASEAEARLSFTVLTDLLAPVIDDVVGELPSPQRRALEAALVLDDAVGDARPDARAVSLGVLGVLRLLAARGLLTLAIDDIQWVDSPSARALSFALGRLTDVPVLLVAALRRGEGHHDVVGVASAMLDVDRISVGPIPVSALGRLLREQLERSFPRPVVVRIHDTSGGNPFFALQIGRAIVQENVRPRPGEPLPIPEDLHLLLRDRLAALAAETRDTLLIAASLATPTVDIVEAAGGSEGAIDDAVRAGIIVTRRRSIEFVHPLLSSTAYGEAGASQKRRVHRTLATLVHDPEEQARHLALSSSGPDEDVAVALDRASRHARARGAPQAGAELCELALAVTPAGDGDLRARRAKALAVNLFDAGDPPHARRVLEELIAQLPSGASRAEATCLLSEFSWKDLGRVSELLHRALAEAGDDPRLRSWFLADLAWVGLDTCDLEATGARARTAVELAEVVGDPYLLRLSLSVLAISEFLVGRRADHLLERAVSIQSAIAAADLSSPATCLGRLATWTGELDVARTTLEGELTRYREQGHETPCYEILAHLAEADLRAGFVDSAARHAEEAADIAAEAGLDVLGEILPVRAGVAALRGDVDRARADATEGLEICERTADRWNEIRCRCALGLLELSLDDAAAARSWLEPLPAATAAMGLAEPGVFPFVPDEVEALVRLGDLPPAQALTDVLASQGDERGRPLAVGTAERCRGLLSAALGDLSGAAAHLERSVEELARVQQPFELARSLLIAGEVERRRKKKASAREALGRARVLFEELGAPIWVEKAGREMNRIGGRAPSPAGLTPTEQQIARLVADGRTNREVAGALFMSIHTVEANLKRIYRKLHVRSRTELARKL
jgi:DNA-binding CsgD family transcriptional regulator